MSRDRVAEVLDVECSFEARSKESSEWCYERGKRSHDKHVELEWGVGDSGWCSTKLVVSWIRASTHDSA
jgi:hypothetical protein